MEGMLALAPLVYGNLILTLAGLPFVAYGLGWTAGMIVRRAHFGLFGNLLVGFLGLWVGTLLNSILVGVEFISDLPITGSWTSYPCLLVAGPLIVAWPLRRRRRA